MKDWERKIKQQNAAGNLYVVTVGKESITARKIDGDYFNSITKERLILPNIYKTRKISA
jgi:hypothetical protein